MTPKLRKDFASSAHNIPSKGIMLRFHPMYVRHQFQFYFCTITLCPNPLPYDLCPKAIDSFLIVLKPYAQTLITQTPLALNLVVKP